MIGKSITVKLFVREHLHDCQLYKLPFKRVNEKEILQIRYSANDSIAQLFVDMFYNSYNYLCNERKMLGNGKRRLSIPSEEREYIVIHSTSFENVIYVECHPFC
jgi:hypothetical protein